MSKQPLTEKKILLLVETAMLTAIIAVMSFTHLGYITVGPLELTLIMVPVIIGAVTLGPSAGAFLGAVFGITSFIQCFTGSALGAILISISVPLTFIVCFFPRLLAGLLCGLVFNFCAKHDKKKGWSYVVASVSGSLLNTVLFLGMLALCFYNISFTAEQAASLGGLDTVLKTVIAIAAGLNAPIELVVCAVIASAIGKALSVAIKKIH